MNTSEIATASKETLRRWISGTVKKVASTRSGKEFPTTDEIVAVCREVGHDNVASMTAYATLETMRSIATTLTGMVGGEEGVPIISSFVPPTADEGDDTGFSPPSEELPLSEVARLKALSALLGGSSKPDPKVVGRLDDLARAVADVTRTVSEVDRAQTLSKERLSKIEAGLGAVEKLSELLGSGAPPPPRILAAAVAAGIGGGKCRMLSEVIRFFVPGEEQTCAIPAVASPPSFGKTYMADTIAALYEAYFLHPFKDDIDEIPNLVGTVVPRSDGSLLVADGPLTAAIRAAASGMNTLFIGDEIFNATRKTLEWMLSTLSPRVYEGKRCYVLTTRQVQEDGTFEVLRAPVDKLHVLFMGNLRGAPPEAFMSRCQLLRFDFTAEWAQEVALDRLEHFSGGAFASSSTTVRAWASKFVAAMRQSREKYGTLEVARPLCFRFLIAAVQNVCRWNASPTVKDLSEYFGKYLPQQIATQNAATQDTDPTSLKVAQAIAEMIK